MGELTRSPGGFWKNMGKRELEILPYLNQYLSARELVQQ